MTPDFDMIIVGAGVSGIGTAVHLGKNCPGKTYCILEKRDNLGGTWDLFRYPGIRSDSDMHTFGYNFKPWTNPKAIADGPSILAYLNETVDEYGVRDNIRFGHRFVGADWSSEQEMWTLTAETADGKTSLTTRWLMLCAGYYSYEEPHNPELTGEDNFKGTIVHPQLWDEDLDYSDKKVIIIGSGATAVTLLPSMAEKASHVTMLQRTPTYIMARPGKDVIANVLNKILPDQWAYNITRFKNELLQSHVYKSARKNPQKAKDFVRKQVTKELGKDWPLDPDFDPPYYPWEQRLCLSPDGDFFDALKSGQADIVTDHIDTFTETGIQTRDGRHIEADLIVKATGLNVQFAGEDSLSIDGETVNIADSIMYEGMMISHVPNAAMIFGYINASWTLRSDLIAEYTCRLINHADSIGANVATPVPPEGMVLKPWIDTFQAGYLLRVLDRLPKQGDRDPWKNEQNYSRDKKVFPTKPVDDGHMVFSGGRLSRREAAE